MDKRYLLLVIPLVGLGLYLLANQLNGVPNHPDQNVLAVYRGGLVTKEQVVAHYRMASSQDQLALRSVGGVRHLIQDLAEHAVVEQWATERQVDTKETFRRALKDATDAVTIRDVAQRMHEFEVKVEESEIQKYFDERRDQFQGQSLTQVRDQIQELLHAQKEQGVIDDFIKQLRANATITINADLLDVPAPAEADVQAYYQNRLDAFREPDRVRVDEIRVRAKDKADRALARIQAGEDFSQVAFETNDPSYVANSDWIGRGVRGTEFDDNVFILSEGQVSKVFLSDGNYLVVRVAGKSVGRVKSLEEVRSTVVAQLRAEREQSYYAEKKSEVLLAVNGIRYTLGDFLDEYNALPADVRAQHSTREDKRQLVQAIADRLLILQSVPAQMAQSQNQKEVEETRRHVLAQILHDDELGGQLDVSDAEVEAHYKQNPGHYASAPKAQISYIRIGRGTDDASRKAAAEKIQATYQRIRPTLPWQTGEDFAAVARQVSEDPQAAQNGGAMEGWISLPPGALMDADTHAFFTTVLSLPAGGIAPPLTLGDSYYLVLVREKVDEQPQPLDKVRELAREDVRTLKHQQALERLGQQLAQRMELKIHEDRLAQVAEELKQP